MLPTCLGRLFKGAIEKYLRKGCRGNVVSPRGGLQGGACSPLPDDRREEEFALLRKASSEGAYLRSKYTVAAPPQPFSTKQANYLGARGLFWAVKKEELKVLEQFPEMGAKVILQ